MNAAATSTRRQVVALVVICALAIAATTGFVLSRRAERSSAAASAAALPSVTSDVSEPRILFRNTALGADYGRVAAVPLTDTLGPRAVVGPACERLDVVATRSICLSRDQGLVTTYRADVGDASFGGAKQLPLVGFPSRTRLARDGALVASTTFITGDSYLTQGFSTRTFVTNLATKETLHVEEFTLVHEGATITPVDRNYWGVTFAADGRTFYVTVAWGGRTWLARGDLSTRTVVTLTDNAECPSLSPDGTRVAFKERVSNGPQPWRLVVWNVATGTRVPLAEQRSVDDQVVWLDDATIIYALPRGGAGTATSDVYRVPADGSGQPALLVKDAWSPAVLH